MSGAYQVREHERYPLAAPVQVSWVDREGTTHLASGVSVDVSIYGLLVELPAAIRLQTDVTVTIDGVPIQARAKVRRCAEIFSWFRIAVEFEQTLLAEDIPLLNETLIKSLRAAPHEQQAAQARCAAAKSIDGLRRSVAKARCLLWGHDFGWDNRASETKLCCIRCGATAENGAEVSHLRARVPLH